jgi:predicted O-methyltransferase YrrM
MEYKNIDGVMWPDVRNTKGESIDGWFDFFILYQEMIDKFDNAVFVEVGTWKGRSTVFMADRIRESGKDIKLYAIDIFGPYVSEGKQEDSSDIYQEFLENIEPYKNFVTPIRGDSRSVHSQFADKSIDFIFIDGGHDYEVVKEDIRLWYPKLKDGGIIGGHDYCLAGIERAVKEYFGKLFNVRGITWLVNYK